MYMYTVAGTYVRGAGTYVRGINPHYTHRGLNYS
jgi:hypothetical protein